MSTRLALLPCVVVATLGLGCPADEPPGESEGSTGGSVGSSDGGGGTTLDTVDDTAGPSDASTTAGDSEGTEGPPAGPWGCLGEVEPPSFSEGEAQVDVTVVDFPGGGTLPDLALRVCRTDDVPCASPHDEGTTDATGTVSLLVPTDGPVYYEVTGDAAAPTLLFRRGVPPSDPDAVELGVLSPATLGLFASIVGARDMPERGHLIITGRDCDQQLAAGVRFEVDTADASSTVVYVAGGLPSAEATATDEAGRGGVLNLPPGPVTITAHVDATGERIGEREIFIRAGEVSAIGMIPTP